MFPKFPHEISLCSPSPLGYSGGEPMSQSSKLRESVGEKPARRFSGKLRRIPILLAAGVVPRYKTGTMRGIEVSYVYRWILLQLPSRAPDPVLAGCIRPRRAPIDHISDIPSNSAGVAEQELISFCCIIAGATPGNFMTLVRAAVLMPSRR